MSDVSKVYATGKEPAVVGKDVAKQAIAGKEGATTANGDLSHVYVDLAK